MEKIFVGIDEAGRGAVLGPLCIAAYVMTSCLPPGIKDSKKLSRKKRELLFSQLPKDNWLVKKIPAKEINKQMESSSLNEIELFSISDLIKEVEDLYKQYELTYLIDCPSTNPEWFKRRLAELTNVEETRLIVEHKADENHQVVGAASIIAKVLRDKAMEEINKVVPCGSGYPSDPLTRNALRSAFTKIKQEVRTKWKTLDYIYQTKLNV